MAEFSIRKMVSTDVAHIVIFHPDDLAHAAEWPIAWYSETFIYPVESESGRLVGWCTTSDGDYAVRLTDGPLSEREARYAGPHWTFPLVVRHGRVLIDNTDALPGEEQMTQPFELTDQWISLDNGDYAVTVTAIQWDAEPQSDPPHADTLPNYVVQFTPQPLARIAAARRPPDLPCLIGASASDAISAYRAPRADLPDFNRLYPAFASDSVAPPGRQFSTEGEAPIKAALAPDSRKFAIFDVLYVAAPALAAGETAVIAECRGTSQMHDRPPTYEFKASQAVKIVGIEAMMRNGQATPLPMTGLFRRRPKPLPEDALPLVRIAPITDCKDEAAGAAPKALQQALVADIEGQGPLSKRLRGVGGYEARRLRGLTDTTLLADWVIDHLPLPARERLRLGILPANARCEAAAAAYAAWAATA